MIKPLQFQNVNFCGANTDSHTNGRIPDISRGIDAFEKEAREVTDSIAKVTETVTQAAGQVGTSAVGIWALCKAPVVKVIDFFSVIKKPEVIENGEVIEKAVKAADWKKLGIAGGIVAGALTVIGIAKSVKKHNDKTQLNNADTFQKSENIAPKEEIKAQETSCEDEE